VSQKLPEGDLDHGQAVALRPEPNALTRVEIAQLETWAPHGQSRRLHGRITLLLIGVVLGVGVNRLFESFYSDRPAVEAIGPAPSDNDAAFIRVGNRIVVPPTSPLRARLIVEPAVAHKVARSLTLPAQVEADPAKTVKVLPPVTGRVIELKVRLGERVMEGQELAVIDSSDLAQAYADEDKARATVAYARKALDRQLGLEKIGGGATKEREQAQNDHTQALAELERAQARLRSIGALTNDDRKTRLLSLKSPISGSVIDLQIAPGAFLNDSAATAMTIANLDTVWVTANVPEKDISFVSENQPVSVTFSAYPEMIRSGNVLFVSDVIEPDTRRAKVRIGFENSNRSLKPGMFAKASFVAPAKEVLLVPTSALLMSNDRTSIFVEIEPWAFERRDADVEYQDDTTAVVKNGLQAGERVIVKGGIVLND
jgi:cobalt-zinc-cadmium efflux system membrane fusion protein